MKTVFNISVLLGLIGLFSQCEQLTPTKISGERKIIANQMDSLLLNNLVHSWYPKSIDTLYGGYLSTFDSAFIPVGKQDKMIVSQSRHLWNNSKAAAHFPNDRPYLEYARHGFKFLKEKMWDQDRGGFYFMVDRAGNPIGDTAKTAYGNAFGLYSISAYYLASKDPEALDLAKKTFHWLETHSHDSIYKGYFQNLDKYGSIVKRPVNSIPNSEIGYKDQNSSIHLLEALTEFYQAWPDPLVKTRLEEMIYLIRDKITNEKGNLILFFQPDWTPVSLRDSSKEVVLKNYGIDHASFGHDIETAYLLMEASHIAGWKDDTITWRKAKRMTDQCLMYGWDDAVGGFYDAGYYFKGEPSISIIGDGKNWWTQSEGLNTLLIMSDLYPNDPLHYFEKFKKQWSYIQNYLIDYKHGDWYSNGLDKDPNAIHGTKGNIWKAAYHQYRSLENCIFRLKGEHE
ncbi:MAG: AGE family epimerase/isomerase [Saprospiraceae bacterium]